MFFRATHTSYTNGCPPAQLEPLPQSDENGMSNIAGLYIAGDLTGVPFLKFSADTSARSVRHIAADADFPRARQQNNLDPLYFAIFGAGVSGMSAALEAREAGFSFATEKANEPFYTLINFTKGKTIYTYPTAKDRAKLSFSDVLALLRGNDRTSTRP